MQSRGRGRDGPPHVPELSSRARRCACTCCRTYRRSTRIWGQTLRLAALRTPAARHKQSFSGLSIRRTHIYSGNDTTELAQNCGAVRRYKGTAVQNDDSARRMNQIAACCFLASLFYFCLAFAARSGSSASAIFSIPTVTLF